MNGVFGWLEILTYMVYTPGNNMAVTGQDATGLLQLTKAGQITLFRFLYLVVNHPLNTVFIL